jgi:hypothetical protein
LEDAGCGFVLCCFFDAGVDRFFVVFEIRLHLRSCGGAEIVFDIGMNKVLGAMTGKNFVTTVVQDPDFCLVFLDFVGGKEGTSMEDSFFGGGRRRFINKCQPICSCALRTLCTRGGVMILRTGGCRCNQLR